MPQEQLVTTRPDIRNIAIGTIRRDREMQAREAVSEQAIADYAELYREDIAMPPVIVLFDGTDYLLADGFHRVEAAVRAGKTEILSEVRTGSKRDAMLFAVGANAVHGLRRTNADKRRAVLMLLGDEEWSRWSDREIARACNVSNQLVGVLRTETGNSPSVRTYRNGNGEVGTMDVSGLMTREAGPKTSDVADINAGESQASSEESLAAKLAKALSARGHDPDMVESAVTAPASQADFQESDASVATATASVPAAESVSAIEVPHETAPADCAPAPTPEPVALCRDAGFFAAVASGSLEIPPPPWAAKVEDKTLAIEAHFDPGPDPITHLRNILIDLQSAMKKDVNRLARDDRELSVRIRFVTAAPGEVRK